MAKRRTASTSTFGKNKSELSNDMHQLIYLASPYSSDNKQVMQRRYEFNVATVCDYLHKGIFLFSPIVHNHPVAQLRDLGRDWLFWKAYDENFLARCDELWVLQLAGWHVSVGVQAEINFALNRGMPVQYLTNEYTMESNSLAVW